MDSSALRTAPRIARFSLNRYKSRWGARGELQIPEIAGASGPGPKGVDRTGFHTNSTNIQGGLCSPADVSRTDQKGPDAWSGEAAAEPNPAEESGAHRVSPARSLGAPSLASRPPEGCEVVYDEDERTRLMADLTRLIRGPSVPQSARLAGLTLIGWLARRRPDETPHAIGIDEARESERRIKSARSKTR